MALYKCFMTDGSVDWQLCLNKIWLLVMFATFIALLDLFVSRQDCAKHYTWTFMNFATGICVSAGLFKTLQMNIHELCYRPGWIFWQEQSVKFWGGSVSMFRNLVCIFNWTVWASNVELSVCNGINWCGKYYCCGKENNYGKSQYGMPFNISMHGRSWLIFALLWMLSCWVCFWICLCVCFICDCICVRCPWNTCSVYCCGVFWRWSGEVWNRSRCSGRLHQDRRHSARFYGDRHCTRPCCELTVSPFLFLTHTAVQQFQWAFSSYLASGVHQSARKPLGIGGALLLRAICLSWHPSNSARTLGKLKLITTMHTNNSLVAFYPGQPRWAGTRTLRNSKPIHHPRCTQIPHKHSQPSLPRLRV